MERPIKIRYITRHANCQSGQGEITDDMWIRVTFTETQRRHCDDIYVTGFTESCQFDNFQWSQWWHIFFIVGLSIVDNLEAIGHDW